MDIEYKISTFKKTKEKIKKKPRLSTVRERFWGKKLSEIKNLTEITKSLAKLNSNIIQR